MEKNKVLLYSTGNHSQYPVINHNGKEREKQCICVTKDSQVAKMVQNLPASAGDLVRSLGREASLEEEVVTHSSILAWRISWTEKPGGLQSGVAVGHD